MKRIPVVGLLSLGMLAVSPVKGEHYDYSGQGTTMRPDTHRYARQTFEGNFERGTAGPYGTDTYAPEYYGPGTKMRPDSHHYDHQRFKGGFEDSTTGNRIICRRGNAYRGVGRSYERGTYRTNVRGMKGEERSGWLGRGNAYDGPGMSGHADFPQN